MAKIRKNNTGFTIIELLVATAVFSVVLLGAAATILQTSRLYYKGIISSRTQTAAREMLESISRPIQLEKQTVIKPINVGMTGSYQVQALCVGTTRITYVIGLESDQNVSIDEAATKIRHAAWRDVIASPQECATGIPDLQAVKPTANGVDLLGQHMRLSDLTLESLQATRQGVWKVRVSVLYGERSLMSPAAGIPNACLGAIAGSQWCARTTYETMVYKRIADQAVTP